jgi:chaperonin GroEL (HSP60 family)
MEVLKSHILLYDKKVSSLKNYFQFLSQLLNQENLVNHCWRCWWLALSTLVVNKLRGALKIKAPGFETEEKQC